MKHSELKKKTLGCIKKGGYLGQVNGSPKCIIAKRERGINKGQKLVGSKGALTNG